MNILIVEDDLLLGLQLEEIVENLKYNVIARVPTYLKAMEAIESMHIDLILLDIELAGTKSGLELAERIVPLQIPIIIVTSHDRSDYYEKQKLSKTVFI